METLLSQIDSLVEEYNEPGILSLSYSIDDEFIYFSMCSLYTGMKKDFIVSINSVLSTDYRMSYLSGKFNIAINELIGTTNEYWS